MAPIKTGFKDILPDDPNLVMKGNGEWGAPPAGAAATWGAITGSLAAQADLGSALDAKAAAGHLHAGVYSPVAHGHAPSEIAGTAIVEGDSRLTNARTPSAHGHAPSEITGTAVVTNDARLADARTPIAHAHTPSEVTGTAVVDNDSRLTNARTPTAHVHAESEVTNLATDLSGKAATSHTHAEANITNLVTDLAGKAASSHSHAPGDVTGTAVITTDGRLSDARTPLAHVHNPVYAALADGATAMAFGTNDVVKVTPTATATYTTTVPAAGRERVLIILTTGTTSRTITFGSGFKPTGTLATGTTTARVFVIRFVSDGVNLYEASRTVAMAA